MAKHNILGKEGENYAADYLDEQGYEILDRNAIGIPNHGQEIHECSEIL